MGLQRVQQAWAWMYICEHTHTQRNEISICKWGPKQLSKWPEITQLRIWLRFIEIQFCSLGQHFVWIKEKLISYGLPWWLHGKKKKKKRKENKQTKKPHLPMQDTWVWSLGWEDSLEEEMATIPVFLPGKCSKQRSMVGYSPWCCRVGPNLVDWGWMHISYKSSWMTR